MGTTIARSGVLLLGHPVAVPTGPAAVSYSTRESVLVRLEDSDGRVGWGETYAGPGVPPPRPSSANCCSAGRPSAPGPSWIC
jgi:L-alanine-DL-glutamate epimerase-like enolase superfamily enzyme